MSLAPFIRLLPAGFDLVLADAGSAGGLKERWAPARSVVSAMLFEPREEAGGPRAQGRDTVYPIALGARAGRTRLNLTALPNMSSTLEPNAKLLAGFRKKAAHARVTGQAEAPVDTLDALCAREGRAPDALKVDTQGSELEVLAGAEACLADSVILAEVEVSFLERYVGQPQAGEVMAFMAARGFDLVDILRQKRYRAANSAQVANLSLGRGQRAGRLAYGDALFVLSESHLAARIAAQPGLEAERLALKAMLGLLVYGKADLAARLLDRAGEAVEPARRARLVRWFAKLGRPWRPWGLHQAADFLARHV